MQAAFETLKTNDTVHPLLRLCQEFINGESDEAGKEAVQYLARSAEVNADVARECLELLINHSPKEVPSNSDRKAAPSKRDTPIRDGIVAGIIRESTAAKSTLAKQLTKTPTPTFEQYYAVGDATANSLAGLVLDKQSWSSEKTRGTTELDVFMLFVAKLLEVGNDYDGRALKGISRLMAADASKLAKIIDNDVFDAILSSLDIRLPVEVRTQATLTAAKYLEVSADAGQKYLAHYITLRVERATCMALTRAFSAAAAVFPIVPSMGASLFLAKGFVPSLVPVVSKKSENDYVEQAALEMLSAACIDSGCRQAIKKHFGDWLRQIFDNSTDQKKGSAAVILAKVQGPLSNGSTSSQAKKAQNGVNGTADLVFRLQQMLLDPNQGIVTSAVEGLAYTSSRSEVKESLAQDAKLLTRLFTVMKADFKVNTMAFGALNIISNLTSYPPTLSEEQKKISELKAYASASKPSDPHPNDLPPAVTARCKAVLSAGVVSAIVNLPRSTLTPSSLSLCFSILLSLAQTQSHRGIMAQQGGAKFLLQSYSLITGTTSQDYTARHTAAWALARILISVNPSLVFPASASPPLTSTIRPLVSLFSSPNTNPFSSSSSTSDTSDASSSSQPHSLLPKFESLLALTNLASCPTSSGVHPTITKLVSPNLLEDLFLSSNEHIQRASVELACNLCVSHEGLALFISDSHPSQNPSTSTNKANSAAVNGSDTGTNTDTGAPTRRLHILLALADSPHVATRRAAGGALASITGIPVGAQAVLARERGVAVILGLCGCSPVVEDADEEDAEKREEEEEENVEIEEDEGCVHRALVCVGNLCAEGGAEGIRQVREAGGVEVLGRVIERRGGREESSELEVVVQIAKEVRAMLVESGEDEGPRIEEVMD